MIENSLIAGFLTQSANTLPVTGRKETANFRNFNGFAEKLNAAVEKNSANSRIIQAKNNAKTENRIDNSIGLNSKAYEPDRDSKVKTYKDVAGEKGQVSSKREVSYDKKNKKLDRTKKEVQSEVAIVEESLAEILNISVEELRMILSALNFDSEDLIDGTKTLEISQKISELFGLNAEQRDTLAKITDFIANEAKNLVNNMQTQGNYDEISVDKSGWVKLEGIDMQVIDNREGLSLENTVFLGNKLKEVLDRLENKLQSEPEKLFEDISSSIKELASDNLGSVSIAGGEEDYLDNLEIAEPKDILKSEDPVLSDDPLKFEEKRNTSGDGNSQETDLKDTQQGYEIINNTQYSQLNEFGSIMSNQRINGPDGVVKAQNEINVSGKEIINQIVDKAKVVLTDEKSEMIIDLKPDHLGKLSLKIITERGSVVAKFIADSEQVKAAIESNMDNLRESLNKQGFSIQDFSVSVRQEFKKGFGENREFSKNNNSSSKGEKIAAIATSNVEEKHRILNPYMVNTSSIDLTA